MHYRLAIVVAALALPSCGGGGGSVTAPSKPVLAPDITLTSAVPDSGATLTAADCPSSTVTPVCTRDLTLTFNVTIGQPLASAAMLVEFYTAAGRRCAVAGGPSLPLRASSPTAMQTSLTLLSAPPDYPQFCSLPATTTRMVAHLIDMNTNASLLQREFSGTYTFTSASAHGGSAAR